MRIILDKRPRMDPPSATIEGSYRTVIYRGSSMTVGKSIEIVDALEGAIIFERASDGGLEHALALTGWIKRSKADEPRHARKITAQANIQLGRLRRHLAEKGSRWEFEKEEERRLKREAERAEAARRQKLRDAAPQMAETLTALYLDMISPRTAESIRRGPHVALLEQALDAAGLLEAAREKAAQ